jgi:hypothetical protein
LGCGDESNPAPILDGPTEAGHNIDGLTMAQIGYLLIVLRLRLLLIFLIVLFYIFIIILLVLLLYPWEYDVPDFFL